MSSAMRFTSVERTLHRIWAEVLGHTDYGLNDDLFDVGGTPVTEAAMWGLIRERFGCDVRPDAAGESVTIGALGLILRGSATPDNNRSLVRLRPGDTSGPSLYCFHPLGGSIARYADLVDILDDEQAVYGIQSVGLAAGCEPDQTIEEMSLRYAEEIAAHAPTGPVVLLGYSLGGTLALETARQLRGRLTHDPRLVLIDVTPEFAAMEASLTAYDALANSALGLGLDVKPLAGMSREDALLAIRSAAAQKGALPRSFSLERLRKFAEVCEVNDRAASAYRPSYLPTDLVLFRSSAGYGLPYDLGWSRYVNDVLTYTLDGDHHEIMETEGLTIIARRLEQILREAGRRELALV